MPSRFVSTDPTLQYPRLLEAMPELVHVTQVNELLDSDNFDIVHDHTTVGPVTAAQRRTPTVVTVHSNPVGEVAAYLSRVDRMVSLVAISHAQRRVAPQLAWHSTIHHGTAALAALRAASVRCDGREAPGGGALASNTNGIRK